VVVEADSCAATRIEANLYKLVNVLRVDDITEQASVSRELALIKLKVQQDQRAEVLLLAEMFRARVIDVAAGALIIAIDGTRDKIDGLVSVLQPFGIVEMVQTGAVAMTRGKESAEPPQMHGGRDELRAA